MEPGFSSTSPLMPLIGWSVIVLVVHILLQAMTATRELGLQWNAGPRDADRAPKGVLAGRAARASSNFRETYPAFIALALALVLKGDAHGWGLGGAALWLGCRILYLPFYLAGVPYLRSLIWLGSMLGLAGMLIALMA